MAFVHYLYTDQQRSSSYFDQTLSQVSHYYKVHGRCSDALRSPAMLGVKRAVRLDYVTRNEEASFHRVMVAQSIIFHRVRGSTGDLLVALAFRCRFCHLLRASEYLNPSGSKLPLYTSETCIVPVSYRVGRDAVGDWRESPSDTDPV